jgi:putative polyketide hydroxylase
MFLIQDTPSKGASASEYPAERCQELIRNGIGKPDLAVEVLDIAHWQPAQLVAEHFQQGRVLLVGDAAHTMPPKLGLGVNTAVQSAQNLAWKLAAVLNGTAAPQLLATYQTERHPVGQLASEQSLVGPAAFVLTQGSDDNLLGADKRVPLFSLVAGYRYRSRAVLGDDGDGSSPEGIELLGTPEELTGLPGTRVPHLWVEREGRRLSTLDLLDGRFVLLAGPAGTPWQEAAPGVAGSLGIDLAAYRLGADGDLLDPEDGWRASWGCRPRARCWSAPTASWAGGPAPRRTVPGPGSSRCSRPSCACLRPAGRSRPAAGCARGRRPWRSARGTRRRSRRSWSGWRPRARGG